MTDIAQDREQPRLDRRTAVSAEMLQRAQIAFLNGVLGVGGITQEIARDGVDVAEIGQGRVAKALRFCLIVSG